MTVLEFKYEICGLLNRAPASLTINGVDLVINAMNRGRSTAQRMADLEFLRRFVYSPAGTSTLYLRGTTTEVLGVKVKTAFLEFDNGTILPVEYQNNEGFLSRLERKLTYDSSARVPNERYTQVSPSKPVVYKTSGTHGESFVLYNVWSNDKTLTDAVTAGTIKINFDGYIKDTSFSLSNKLGFTYSGSVGSTKGPYVYEINVIGIGLTASVPQVGYFKDNLIFANNAETMFVWYSNTNGTVGGPHWALSNKIGENAYTWEAPPGVDAISSAATWSPVGFSPGGSLTSSGFNVAVAGSSGTDQIWLDECGEWLQLYTLQYLQTHFIKDQTRWPVTQKMVDKAWESLMDWNTSQGQGEIQYDLE